MILKSPTGCRTESDSQEGTRHLKSPTGHRVESDSQEGASDHKRSAHRCRKTSRAMMCTDGTCVRVWSWKILSGDRPAGGCDFKDHSQGSEGQEHRKQTWHEDDIGPKGKDLAAELLLTIIARIFVEMKSKP